MDVSSKRQVDGLAERAVQELSRIDVWANVAGILRHGPISETTEEGLDSVVGVNLKGVYWGTAAAGRVMTAAGRGSIVNIASAGGDMPTPNISVYGLTKAAVIHLTKTAAMEFGPSGVRVNAVAPGFIDTPMVAVHWTDADGRVDEDKRRSMLELRAGQSPLGVNGEPADIAYAMLYLASDASRFMTGQVMRPNGGVVMP
jgi:3-oxoacyl-[acyl-carrier protein] reductase